MTTSTDGCKNKPKKELVGRAFQGIRVNSEELDEIELEQAEIAAAPSIDLKLASRLDYKKKLNFDTIEEVNSQVGSPDRSYSLDAAVLATDSV